MSNKPHGRVGSKAEIHGQRGPSSCFVSVAVSFAMQGRSVPLDSFPAAAPGRTLQSAGDGYFFA